MYKILRIKFYGNPSEGTTPLHVDRRTDMTKLIGDFHDFATIATTGLLITSSGITG
jgi:hypothetical protein